MKKYQEKLIAWQTAAFRRANFSFIKTLIQKFPAAELYLVGGAVRDIIIGRPTKDFDLVVGKISANDLEKFLNQHGEVNLVGKSFGVFKFIPASPASRPAGAGSSAAKTAAAVAKAGDKITGANPIEIALPRTEHAGMSGGYRDFEIQSDKNLSIEEDLSRRDFTINALAWDIKNKKLIDQFNGIKDLQNQTIKAIGRPEQRFQEDYSRMLRAVRFACQLGFTIDKPTLNTIRKKAPQIATIAGERINEELTKIIMSDNAELGFRLMQQIGLLKILIPELEAGVHVKQNLSHIYEVFEHNVRALGAAAQRGYKLEIRLAALFHDVAKPITKAGRGPTATFYNHDQEGAKMTRTILKRLHFSNDIIKHTVHLVRYHMFYYALDTVSDSGVRRLLNRLGRENIDDFINLRICDRLGMGRPKAKPWKLIELERRFKEVQLDPITPKMLKLKGDELMELLAIKPGPKVGLILNALLGEVLEDPGRNNKKYLKNRAKQLNALVEPDLKKLNPDLAFYEEERKRLLHQK
ncbi:MAG TPA: CCA tRNA nucleotidyltransferase [bacterium]|nr:CCA tRNA nucleotidyltransferase [bacterium]HNS33974.1 CCA tRNA nucleotidyltransferase [bacterium]